MKRFETGDEVIVMICTRGTIIQVSDSHGLCYKVQLDPKDFQPESRTLWVEPHEVTDKTTVGQE